MDSRFGMEMDKHLFSWLQDSDILPFKTGLYTALMLAFMVVTSSIIYALYCMLHGVIRPMMWAVLVGTVVFPVKLHIANCFQSWLDTVEQSGVPLLLALATLPLQLADACVAAIVSRVANRTNLILLLVYFFIWCFSRNGPLVSVLHCIQRLWSAIDILVTVGSSFGLCCFVVVYFITICLTIKVLHGNVNKIIVRLFSVPIWFALLCNVAAYFGSYRATVAVVLTILLIVVNLELFTIEKKTPGKPSSADHPSQASTTEVNYTQLALGAATFVFLLKYNYAFFLIILLSLLALLRKACSYFFDAGHWSQLTNYLCMFFEGSTIKTLYSVWIPGQMRYFFRCWFYGTPKLFRILRDSSSLLSSLFVMASIVCILFVLFIFFFFQITDEMTSLTVMTSDLIRQSWAKSASMPVDILQKAFPISNETGNIWDEAYDKGRLWLSSKLRNLVSKDSPERADAVEAQFLHLIDELYNAFNEGRSKLTTVGDQSVNTLWNQLGAHDYGELIDSLTVILHTNLALIYTIAETAWAVLVANLNTLFSLTLPLIWEVFTFGYGVVNLILQTVMFGTTLNFLLISSKDTWLPADIVNWLLPFSSENNESSRSVIFSAFSRNIRSVFIITVNMALFYGLYTWLLCSLFGLSMTVVPSITAAILATVPVMSPWCVCLPGVVELWLVNGETVLAVLLFAFFIIPQLVVDESFYAELNESHPYLTGLAICGGVYWLGLEGAIIGPILLCCFLIVATLCRSFGKSINI